MKICLINNLFTPDKKGGVETVVEIIANELQKQGHNVFVICAGDQKDKTTEDKINKIKVYRVGWDKYFAFQNIDQQNIFSRFFYRIHQLNNKYSAKIVKAILNKEKPKLILSHNTLGLGYNVIKEINKTDIKHINTIHDVQLLIPSGKLMVNQIINKSEKIYAFFTKNIFKNCKYIISSSQTLLDFYTKRKFFPNAETQIIPNPLIPIKRTIIKEKNPFEKLKLLYIGQLERHKGVMNLIKALRLLKQDEFFLTIAGRGTLNEQIKNTENILSNFKFFGEYNEKERIELLKKHDLIIVPSLCFENAPMVILEAWQSGVPVLASNFGGISELIEENKNGWLFDPENLENLKEKLEEIYKIKNNIPKMSEYCLKNVSKFNVKNYLDKILKIN
jgi:glycosyltransferase involved in cell wall biosynthesis